MKHIIFILIAGILVMLSCKKKEDPDAYEKNWGWINAEKNGQPWNGTRIGAANLYANGRFSISVSTYKAPYVMEENLSISFIPKAAGHYRINEFLLGPVVRDTTRTEGLFTTLVGDGDAICNVYNVLESDSTSNFIKIESFDAASGEVKGRFSLNMLVIRKCAASAPDTMVVKNARFHTKILK